MNTYGIIGCENAPKSTEIKIPHMEGIKCTADIYGLPVHAVRMMVANGDVVSIRVGKKILVNVDSLTEFLNTGVPQGAAAHPAENSSRSVGATMSRIAPIPLRR